MCHVMVCVVSCVARRGSVRCEVCGAVCEGRVLWWCGGVGGGGVVVCHLRSDDPKIDVTLPLELGANALSMRVAALTCKRSSRLVLLLLLTPHACISAMESEWLFLRLL